MPLLSARTANLVANYAHLLKIGINAHLSQGKSLGIYERESMEQSLLLYHQIQWLRYEYENIRLINLLTLRIGPITIARLVHEHASSLRTI